MTESTTEAWGQKSATLRLPSGMRGLVLVMALRAACMTELIDATSWLSSIGGTFSLPRSIFAVIRFSSSDMSNALAECVSKLPISSSAMSSWISKTVVLTAARVVMPTLALHDDTVLERMASNETAREPAWPLSFGSPNWLDPFIFWRFNTATFNLAPAACPALARVGSGANEFL